MMILRTRKEQYLNEIVGNGNTAPGTPYTREELFFADILGEVNAPVPVTRIEIYLAKIANKYSGEMPEPKTRIEKFIARAAGMDVIIPTPITREEMLWANYALIVEKELSGIPPLTFNAIAGALKNYRIYGNTVNGESVGELVTDSQSEHYGKYAITITNNSETANIYLDEPLRKVGNEAEYVDYAAQKWHRVRKNLANNVRVTSAVTVESITEENGFLHIVATNNSERIVSVIVSRQNNYSVGDYDIVNNSDKELRFDYKDENEQIINDTVGVNKIKQFSILNAMSRGLNIYFSVRAGESINTYIQVMIVKHGVDASKYEPYIENTEVDVILSGIAVTAGTNTLTVGTAVQPSKVYIKYEGAR